VAPEPAREGKPSFESELLVSPYPFGPALQDIHEAMETVRSQREVPSGILRINAFPTAAREIMAPLTLEFLRRYPAIQSCR
jgi:DNA-binding transcriptional LysR family regulator